MSQSNGSECETSLKPVVGPDKEPEAMKDISEDVKSEEDSPQSTPSQETRDEYNFVSCGVELPSGDALNDDIKSENDTSENDSEKDYESFEGLELNVEAKLEDSTEELLASDIKSCSETHSSEATTSKINDSFVYESTKDAAGDIVSKDAEETKVERKNPDISVQGGIVWYSCDKCDRKYKDRRDLRGHKVNHGEAATFVCKICKKTFRWRSTLRRHRKVCSGPNATKQETKMVKPKKQSKKVKPEPTSESCSKGVAVDNVVVHDSIKDCQTTSDNVVLQQSTTDYQTTSDNKMFSCPECFASFDTKKECKAHKVNFHDDNPLYACDKCDRKYKDRRDLRGHKSTHGGDATFVCRFCPEKFRWRKNLRRHYKMNHEVPTASTEVSKPAVFYSCSDCSETFAKETQLRKHIRKSHPQPRSCKDCNEVFATGQELWIHRSKIHRKYVACHLCGKAFQGQCPLKRHILSHTGEKNFLCDMCPLAFSCKDSLMKHQRIHTTTEPNFFCSQCGKGFMQRQYLIQHIRTHTYPFQCDFCQRRFCEHFMLVKHMKEHLEEIQQGGPYMFHSVFM